MNAPADRVVKRAIRIFREMYEFLTRYRGLYSEVFIVSIRLNDLSLWSPVFISHVVAVLNELPIYAITSPQVPPGSACGCKRKQNSCYHADCEYDAILVPCEDRSQKFDLDWCKLLD